MQELIIFLSENGIAQNNLNRMHGFLLINNVIGMIIINNSNDYLFCPWLLTS